MKLFILFQTDQYKSAHTKTVFGVFSTQEEAEFMATHNIPKTYNSDYVIEECELNKFGEI